MTANFTEKLEAARLYSAGISRRLVKSPAAPKIATQGAGSASRVSFIFMILFSTPSIDTLLISDSVVLLYMSTELVAHR